MHKKNNKPHQKFMELPEEFSNNNSYFNILPIEYEGKVSYGKGASKGSKEIIKASKYLEYYDDEFNQEPFLKGIYTYSPIKRFEDICINNNKGFTIALGGDHSCSIPIIKQLDNDVSIIIFDAHPDMFHSWNNSQYNHRCTSQRASDKHKLLILGARSMDKDEYDIIKCNKNVAMIKSYEYNKEKLKNELKKLKNKIYISIDIDVFDCSFIRNTGTPEPGGFFWQDIIEMLKIIFQNKDVISADIMEFSPNSKNILEARSEAYSLAKLCYKLMALKIYYN
jgi:agmatinase